jgi:predicted dehydrogenase
VNPQLTAVVVGCGRIGSGYDERHRDGTALTHAGSYAAHPQVRLIGGVDRDLGARSRFEARWGVRAYPDVDELLELGPDVVSVATPPEGRLGVVERVLAAGPRALWIEKPLASTVAEANAIVEACRAASVSLQLNFHRRYDPQHRAVAAVLHADGVPIHVDFRFSGTLSNFGSHAIDLFRWFAGEPDRVRAIALDDRDPCAVLTTTSGSTGALLQVWADGVTVFDVDVLTPVRRISIAALGEQVGESRTRPARLYDEVRVHPLPSARRASGPTSTMAAAADALVGHIERGDPLLCAGEDGTAALRLEQAIMSAARTGEAVEVGR